MENWPIPQDLRDLRGFLRLTCYYYCFVWGYVKITGPLTNFLKKNMIQQAFEGLKRAMVTILILVMPNFTKEFMVETNALGSGLGVILMQDERPMACLSKASSLQSQGKLVYEKELITIVMALQKWHHYLFGRHFKVKIDQRSMKFLIE